MSEEFFSPTARHLNQQQNCTRSQTLASEIFNGSTSICQFNVFLHSLFTLRFLNSITPCFSPIPAPPIHPSSNIHSCCLTSDCTSNMSDPSPPTVLFMQMTWWWRRPPPTCGRTRYGAYFVGWRRWVSSFGEDLTAEWVLSDVRQ